MWGRSRFWTLFLLIAALRLSGATTLSSASATPLTSIDAAGLSILIETFEQGSYSMSITSLDPSSSVPPPKIMVLQNPTRLVIDLTGTKAQRGQTIRLKDSSLSALRFAPFGDGTRFVFDFRGKTDPRYVWQKNPMNGSVVLRFSIESVELERSPRPSSEPSAAPTPRSTLLPPQPKETPESAPTVRETAAAKTPVPIKTPFDLEPIWTPTPTVEKTAPEKNPPRLRPTPTPVPTPVPSPVLRPVPPPPTDVPETPTPFLKQMPEDTPEPVRTFIMRSTPQPTEAAPTPIVNEERLSGGPDEGVQDAVLQTIAFRFTGKTKVPAVVFSVSGLKEYSLNSMGEGAYDLALKGVRVENRSLLLPAMPPENFERFEVVVPRVAGAGIHVKIRVEQGVTLIPFVAGNELWIKAERE